MPWPSDLNKRTWPRYSEDVHTDAKHEVSGSKLSEVRAWAGQSAMRLISRTGRPIYLNTSVVQFRSELQIIRYLKVDQNGGCWTHSTCTLGCPCCAPTTALRDRSIAQIARSRTSHPDTPVAEVLWWFGVINAARDSLYVSNLSTHTSSSAIWVR